MTLNRNLIFVFAALTLALTAQAPAVRADDALVLPQGVFRFTAGSSFMSAKQSYGETGDKTDLGASLGTKVKATAAALNPALASLNPTSKVEASITRQDFGLEYGLTDLLSLSAQLPIYLSATAKVIQNTDMATALGAVNSPLAPTSGAGKIGELFTKLSQDGRNAGSMGDLLIGAKYQFAHSGSTPIATEAGTYRAAFALGTKLPTSTVASPDTNDISTATDANTKSLILGGRTYFDYQFTDFFYLNFYSEHEYRLAGSTRTLVTNPATMSYSVLDTKYQPGFYNHLELDFVLMPKLAENLLSESGVRLTGDFTGVGKYTEATGAEALLSNRDPAAHTYRISPYVGVFYTGAPFPMKLKVISYLASGGQNTKELTGFSGILYAYLKF